MELVNQKILKLPSDTELLTPSDYKNIFCDEWYKRKFIKLNGKIYHAKDTFLFLNELVGEEVSKYFNLQTVDSIISLRTPSTTSVLGCDEILLLTELFTNEFQDYADVNMFKKAKFHKGVGLDNLDHLYCYYHNGLKKYINISSEYVFKLQNDIKTLAVRDFMVQQRDRHEDNFMFSYDNDKVELMPVFDYEYSFGDGDLDMYFGYFDLDLKLEKVINYVKKDTFFQQLFKKAMDLNINSLIDNLENKGIILDENERIKYVECVDQQKQKIINTKLII